METMTYDQDLSYQSTDLPGGHVCHVQFSGKFNNQAVIWQAEIGTLAYYLENGERASGHDNAIRQFIEVGDTNRDGRRIRIGLNVNRIDETVIKKCIIMVRQYKNLTFGRHEYGEFIIAGEH